MAVTKQITRQRKPERRTILSAPDTLDELLRGQIVNKSRQTHAIIVLDRPDGADETHALFVLSHHRGPRGVTRFRGQLHRRLSNEELTLQEIEGTTDSDALKSVPVRGHFCEKTRCGAVTLLPV